MIDALIALGVCAGPVVAMAGIPAWLLNRQPQAER